MMPKVENLNSLLNSLSDDFKEIAKIVIKKDGSIRSSKPNIDKNERIYGKAAYVWRMVVFFVSQKHQHQCMPVTADFDLPAYDENGKWSCSIAREMAEELNVLVDNITDNIPKYQHYGVIRWGRALGAF